jgi:hypothetical protein
MSAPTQPRKVIDRLRVNGQTYDVLNKFSSRPDSPIVVYLLAGNSRVERINGEWFFEYAGARVRIASFELLGVES